ncbi:DUF364 domain-containing protein [Corynebacterium sp. J010B-136]|uniref:DUF364 domain-containing protein n=1 Tax=Corynebacterium sp. J010B-136 TaxID=2099401 RepID=UPI000CF96BED|nr:DUF364 domain-containing protein [Corynebacterium sp. J010B-136]PQM73811.1 hypothetical protein C5Y44_10035 [Corynebacterium sp. J010B-136]
MSSAAEFYDKLLAEILDTPVAAVSQGFHWTRVTTTDQAMGLAYTMAGTTRPEISEKPYQEGESLTDVARLTLSWNLCEAAIGAAALNAHFSTPEVARHNGFTPAGEGQFYPQVFEAFFEIVAGKKVAVVGHFPFAPAALEKASDFAMLETNAQPGDYPASACEFILPEADFVFLSGSAIVNKTLPRLLELSQDAFTTVVGPSTPLSPVLFDAGADYLAGLVTTDARGMEQALSAIRFPGMMDNGFRADQFSPGTNYRGIVADLKELY